MNHFLSQKFKFYSFVSISLLLYVHGYNLHETYLTPYSTVQEPLTFTTFIEYFFANGALRFRIPLLFMISGYIFTLHSKRPYAARIKRRFATLIVPFLFWSAVGILITYLWQQSTVTAQAVKDAAIDQLGDNRPYNEIGWLGVLYRWLVKPVSFHLWFIRSLFIYNLLYPVISWFISKAPTVWFALVFLFWHTIFNFSFIEGQGLFFFSLGILINTSNYPIHKKPLWFSDYLSWLFFLGISVIKTFMAFELEPNNPATPLILYALHDTSIGAGILAVWFGADPIVKWCMDKKWFQWVASFSFIIFAFHVPLVHYTTRLAFIYWNHLPNYRLLTYLIVPVFIFFFCVVTGVIFRKVFPKAYRFATGGRGL